MMERLSDMGRTFFALLPQIVLALLLLVVTWLLAKGAGWLVGWTTRRSTMRPSLISLLQNLASILVWLAGILVAATVALPEMSPTDLLAALGIGSVAIGFAFKDVFENFLAGILILYREPMRLHDHIA
jgi:small-conductance mechanosensitive channel